MQNENCDFGHNKIILDIQDFEKLFFKNCRCIIGN